MGDSGLVDHRSRAYLVLALSVLAISWAAPLIRFSDAHPLAISFWRIVIALPVIALIVRIRGEHRWLSTIDRAEGRIMAVAGAFLALHFALWIASVQFTSVAASVALVTTQPIWVAILGRMFLGEHPTRRQWMGIVVAMAGALVIGYGDLAGGSQPFLGDVLALAGAGAVAVYYVIGRRVRRRLPVWPYVLVVYSVAACAVLAMMLATGVPIFGYATIDWLVFVGLAAGPMLIGHTGQNYALGYLPAHTVNLTLLGEPVGATLIAWMLPSIGETPPALAIAGGGLILSGILLGLERKRK